MDKKIENKLRKIRDFLIANRKFLSLSQIEKEYKLTKRALEKFIDLDRVQNPYYNAPLIIKWATDFKEKMKNL